MAIPDEPGSRVEQYLGVLMGQDTAQLPDVPQSRIEEYLAYIVQNMSGNMSENTNNDMDSIVLRASDDTSQQFRITVDTDGKLTLERIA